MKTISFKMAFFKKYPLQSKYMFKHFKNHFGKIPDWKDFTKLNLIDFISYLKNSGVCQSSIRTYCAILKSILNDYSDEVNIPCKDFDKILSIRNVKSRETFLTESELDKICNLDVSGNNIYMFVKKIFLISAYTGCRHSDAILLDERNITNDRIDYVSQKTNIFASIPLKPIIKDLILLPNIRVNDVTFNNVVRDICRKAGIKDQIKIFKRGKHLTGEKWQFVSSHTARRSFATNLHLRGVDLYTISRLMGHTDIKSTTGYICCDVKLNSPEIIGYFS